MLARVEHLEGCPVVRCTIPLLVAALLALRSAGAFAAVPTDLGCATGPFDRVVAPPPVGAAPSVEAMSTAIARDPGDPEAYFGRGLAYAAIGKKGRSFDDFSKALALAVVSQFEIRRP